MIRHFIVEGAVQGVGYRYFALKQGRRLGLAGWVRNLPDGSVETVAQGDPAAIERFEAALREGPLMASVTKLLAREISDQQEALNSFEIR